jgi:DNA-binding PucR family transcriptional regulator
MERDLPWFRGLRPEDRAWIGLVAQNGIAMFARWLRASEHDERGLVTNVFGSAPPALARVVTLQQTVEMVRTTITVAEQELPTLYEGAEASSVHAELLLFSRELAFAAADVYARAAEMRGAWDARLEALVVDAVLRGEADEAVHSRAAAVGWRGGSDVAVVVGLAPPDATGPGEHSVVELVRRTARQAGLDSLASVHGDRLVVVLGGVGDLDKAAALVAGCCGDGPVVIGPAAADLLGAQESARAAVAGLRAARGWPEAPRCVRADDLLPERCLSGDESARLRLLSTVHEPLSSEPVLLRTAEAYVGVGGSVEACARELFVHANTVRYRLRRIAEMTGLNPSGARDAYTLHLAVTLGRLSSLDT